MKAILIRRDKSIEVHRTRAENVLIDDFLYLYDSDALLHMPKGWDKKAIVFVEGKSTPVNFSKIDSMSVEDGQILNLVTHDMARVRAIDEFRDLKRADNTTIWVLVLVIAMMAILQIISVVKI
jgi:hypothetical protein